MKHAASKTGIRFSEMDLHLANQKTACLHAHHLSKAFYSHAACLSFPLTVCSADLWDGSENAWEGTSTSLHTCLKRHNWYWNICTSFSFFTLQKLLKYWGLSEWNCVIELRGVWYSTTKQTIHSGMIPPPSILIAFNFIGLLTALGFNSTSTSIFVYNFVHVSVDFYFLALAWISKISWEISVHRIGLFRKIILQISSQGQSDQMTVGLFFFSFLTLYRERKEFKCGIQLYIFTFCTFPLYLTLLCYPMPWNHIFGMSEIGTTVSSFYYILWLQQKRNAHRKLHLCQMSVACL